MTPEWVDRTVAGVVLAVLVTAAVLAALMMSQLSVAPTVADGTGVPDGAGAIVDVPDDGSAARVATGVRG